MVWADQLDAVARDCEAVFRQNVSLPPPLPTKGTIVLTCEQCSGISAGEVWAIHPNGKRIEVILDALGVHASTDDEAQPE